MFVFFNYGFSCGDYDFTSFPYPGDYELTFCLAADILYALVEDIRIADYVFCDEGIVRMVYASLWQKAKKN